MNKKLGEQPKESLRKKHNLSSWDTDVEVKRKTYTDYENKGVPKLAMGKANVKLQGVRK